MRTLVLTLAVLMVGTTAASAQSGAWADKMFKGANEHNFGSVPRGAQLYHRFLMTNIWAVPLELTSVRVSCGCVTATPSVKLLQPSQSAYLDVTMDAHRFTGSKTVSIYITLGPQYTSTATLRVSANSRADVVFNPGQINFGVVQRGQAATQVIDVESAGVLDWRLTELDKGSAPVDVVGEQLYRERGRVGYRLRMTLKPDAPAGLLKHELLLKTNDPASPLLTVLLEAVVQAPVTVKPNPLKLGSVPVGQTVTRRVNVYGGKPFKILAIEGLGDGIQAADLPQAAASVQTVTLSCQAAQPGEYRRQLRIQTDLPDQPPVVVTIEGTVAP
jgi:hypothetical protein